jgi:hypothetical protein
VSYHTILYRPLERTYEEARQLAIKSLSHKIKRSESKDGALSYPVERLKKVFGEGYESILIGLLNHKKKWLRRIESDRPIFRAAVWLFQPDDPVYIRERKTWYVSCANDRPPIVNPFRVQDCEVTLLSLGETLEYLKSKAEDKSLQLFPDTYDQLEEFWKLYPEGMIQIG